MKLNWKQNPDKPNSFLAEHLGFRFEVASGRDAGSDNDMWSYACITPHDEGYEYAKEDGTIVVVPPQFDHYLDFDTADEAKKAAEDYAIDIGYE